MESKDGVSVDKGPAMGLWKGVLTRPCAVSVSLMSTSPA